MTKVVSSSAVVNNGMPVFYNSSTSIMGLIKTIESGGKLNTFLNKHPEVSMSHAMKVLDMVGLSHKLDESHFVKPVGSVNKT